MDNPRIEDLRRRVEKDPASIAFAQLAEEYRRAGKLQESVDACRAGLQSHPGYLSARVTLGRALLELGEVDAAKTELELVLKSAPENLAAIRGLAEIHHRRGSLTEALHQYEAALSLARNDPDLEEAVSDLKQKVTPKTEHPFEDGLSAEMMEEELAGRGLAAAPLTLAFPNAANPVVPVVPVAPVAPVEPAETPEPDDSFESIDLSDAFDVEVDEEDERAHHTLAALHQLLTAIHVTRSERRA